MSIFDMTFLDILLSVYLSAFVFLAWMQHRALKARRLRIAELERDIDLTSRKFQEDFDNAVDFYLEKTAKGKVNKLKQDLTKSRQQVERLTKYIKSGIKTPSRYHYICYAGSSAASLVDQWGDAATYPCPYVRPDKSMAMTTCSGCSGVIEGHLRLTEREAIESQVYEGLMNFLKHSSDNSVIGPKETDQEGA